MRAKIIAGMRDAAKRRKKRDIAER